MRRDGKRVTFAGNANVLIGLHSKLRAKNPRNAYKKEGVHIRIIRGSYRTRGCFCHVLRIFCQESHTLFVDWCLGMGILQYNPHFNFSYLGQAWRGIRRRRWVWGAASLLNGTCRPWCSKAEHCLRGLHAPRTDAVPGPDEPCREDVEDFGGLG